MTRVLLEHEVVDALLPRKASCCSCLWPNGLVHRSPNVNCLEA